MRGSTCTTLSMIIMTVTITTIFIIPFFSHFLKISQSSFLFSSSMATSLSTCFQPITIISSSSTNRLSQIKPPAAASGKWWTPIFNLSPDPDYINNPETETNKSVTEILDLENSRSRFAPGCFTEEKAKQLRMKTVESANFHDIMYHSAIASRLASDVSGRWFCSWIWIRLVLNPRICRL